MDLKPSHYQLAGSFKKYSEINRTDVLDFYKSGAPDCDKFVLAMIWGGIGRRNLNLLQSIGKKELNKKLSIINTQISKSLSKDFINEYFSNSSIHISGVGLSFLTKHFYFQNQGVDYLIYDKWTKRVHAAILSESDPKLLIAFFRKIASLGINKDLFIKSRMEGQAYLDFCSRMDALFLSLKSSKDLKSKFSNKGELESFLFGEGRKINEPNNPRNWLFRFLKNNYNPIILTANYLS
jgi:hypothetical protein